MTRIRQGELKVEIHLSSKVKVSNEMSYTLVIRAKEFLTKNLQNQLFSLRISEIGGEN